MAGFRILPVVITVAVLLLTLKIGDAWQSTNFLGTSPAIGAEPQSSTAIEEGKTAGGDTGDYELVERLSTPDVIDVSPMEIRMLENLLVRREQLEKRERDIDMRERLLAAAEIRINEKIDELKEISTFTEDLVRKFNTREDKKITRLVKIYAAMKSKDAARIFNELEIDILLEMLSIMSEAKAATIIANMASNKAKIVTRALARRNILPVAAATAANVLN